MKLLQTHLHTQTHWIKYFIAFGWKKIALDIWHSGWCNGVKSMNVHSTYLVQRVRTSKSSGNERPTESLNFNSPIWFLYPYDLWECPFNFQPTLHYTTYHSHLYVFCFLSPLLALALCPFPILLFFWIYLSVYPSLLCELIFYSFSLHFAVRVLPLSLALPLFHHYPPRLSPFGCVVVFCRFFFHFIFLVQWTGKIIQSGKISEFHKKEGYMHIIKKRERNELVYIF